jgi:hypothetical protein
MRLGWAIAIGLCTAIVIVGLSDGGLAEPQKRRAPPPPVPGFELVRRIALTMVRGCGSPQTVDRSTSTQVIKDFRCTEQVAGAQSQALNIFTWVRARAGRTQPGTTNADRYFVNEGVVVLAYTPPTPSLPHVPAAPFAYAIRRACHCGQVVKPTGI